MTNKQTSLKVYQNHINFAEEDTKGPNDRILIE